MKTWTINSDMGENIGNDHLLMPFLNECCIACGGHVGDESSMQKTVDLALKHGVSIGAHPSFPDQANFGRIPMRMEKNALSDTLRTQIDALRKIYPDIEHIKPHGALYNMAAVDPEIAWTVLEVIKDYPGTMLMAPWKSTIAQMAEEQGIKVRFEGYGDRRYHSNMALVSRKNPAGVISKANDAVEQVKSISDRGIFISIEGDEIEFVAETFCVHGDNPDALKILQALHHLKVS